MTTSHATSDFLAVAAEERLYNAMRENFWFPVAYPDDLRDEPQGFTLFGENLVVARLEGEARVFEDLCRHRGSALSLGKIVEGRELRCSYHGWTYNAEGRVTRVPAKEELSPAFANVRLPSFPTLETSGLVYTTLGDPKFPPPAIDELDDPSYRFLHLDIYEWNCSLPRRLENYFDFSHFAWVHDGILGDSEQPHIEDYDVDRVGGELRFIAGPFVEFTDAVGGDRAGGAQTHPLFHLRGPQLPRQGRGLQGLRPERHQPGQANRGVTAPRGAARRPRCRDARQGRRPRHPPIQAMAPRDRKRRRRGGTGVTSLVVVGEQLAAGRPIVGSDVVEHDGDEALGRALVVMHDVAGDALCDLCGQLSLGRPEVAFDEVVHEVDVGDGYGGSFPRRAEDTRPPTALGTAQCQQY